MRRRLRRLWCRFWHIGKKAEAMSNFKWQERCLECGEVYPLEPREL